MQRLDYSQDTAGEKKTLKEIAHLADVSTATVSMALRDSPRVKEETRVRIKKVADMMGYQPSVMARGLALGKTFTIGIIIPSLSQPHAADLAEEIQKELHEHGYLGIVLSADTPEDVNKAIRTLLSRKVDGLACGFIDRDDLASVQKERVPLVLYDCPGDSAPETNGVVVDKRQGTTEALEHLARLGHTKIGLLGNPFSDQEPRFLAYRDFLRRHGLVERPEWIIRGRGFHTTGYDGMKQILSLPERPTACFCMNDLVAVGAMLVLRKAGLKVPDDMALVGFDNIPEGEYASVPLTTVDQPRAEIAHHVVDLLLSAMREQNGRPARKTVIKPKLIIRESCGAYKQGGAS